MINKENSNPLNFLHCDKLQYTALKEMRQKSALMKIIFRIDNICRGDEKSNRRTKIWMKWALGLALESSTPVSCFNSCISKTMAREM
jgi:hypothetical protein